MVQSLLKMYSQLKLLLAANNIESAEPLIKTYWAYLCGMSTLQRHHFPLQFIEAVDLYKKKICPFCCTSHPTTNALRLCIATHSTMDPFYCKLCKMSFKYHNLYKNHIHNTIVKRNIKQDCIFCLYCNEIIGIQKYPRHLYDRHFPLLPLLVPFPKLEFKRILSE